MGEYRVVCRYIPEEKRNFYFLIRKKNDGRWTAINRPVKSAQYRVVGNLGIQHRTGIDSGLFDLYEYMPSYKAYIMGEGGTERKVLERFRVEGAGSEEKARDSFYITKLMTERFQMMNSPFPFRDYTQTMDELNAYLQEKKGQRVRLTQLGVILDRNDGEKCKKEIQL